MIKPKRGYARTVHKAGKEVTRRCKNPGCGAKLPRQNKKYCDRICRQAHDDILKQERRPEQAFCALCNKPLDMLRAPPSYWIKHAVSFCDEICADGYRRQSGQYEEMSRRGNAAMKEYKKEHGHVAAYKDRAEITSKGNKERPPKSKHFTREGRAWGYDVRFYPHDGQGYRISVPELEELGVLFAKTKKEGLKLVRERVLELRTEEAKGE
jgi:hypothetical protein